MIIFNNLTLTVSYYSMPTQETLHPYKKRHSNLVGVALIYIENDLIFPKQASQARFRVSRRIRLVGIEFNLFKQVFNKALSHLRKIGFFMTDIDNVNHIFNIKWDRHDIVTVEVAI